MMWKTRIIGSSVFLLLALTVRSAQDSPDAQRQRVVLGLVRAINTVEVADLSQHGAYEPWPILLAQDQEDFNGSLKRFNTSDDPNAVLVIRLKSYSGGISA